MPTQTSPTATRMPALKPPHAPVANPSHHSAMAFLPSPHAFAPVVFTVKLAGVGGIDDQRQHVGPKEIAVRVYRVALECVARPVRDVCLPRLLASSRTLPPRSASRGTVI